MIQYQALADSWSVHVEHRDPSKATWSVEPDITFMNSRSRGEVSVPVTASRHYTRQVLTGRLGQPDHEGTWLL